MKLLGKEVSQETRNQIAADTGTLVASQLANGRVCGDTCQSMCTQCGATNCRCNCSPNCAMAGQALSSDPEKHPIEPMIVPLVYVFKTLEVFTPCWSCEGHDDNSGKLWKLPRVWFYSESTVHVRLLAEVVQYLHVQNRLNVRWHVGVNTAEPSNPHTIFHLEPAVEATPGLTLESLREDVRTLSANIPAMMVSAAQRLTLAHG